MQVDIARFLASSVLMIVIVLAVVFRRVAGVVLPLLTVVLSLLTTLGAMPLLGIALSLTTEILPPFLLTIGVCYSVHVLAIFFQRLDRGEFARGGHRVGPGALGPRGPHDRLDHRRRAGLVCVGRDQAGRRARRHRAAGRAGRHGLLAGAAAGAAGGDSAAGRGHGAARAQCLHDRSRRRVRPLPVPGTPSAWSRASAGILLLAGVGASRLHFSNDYSGVVPEDDPVRPASELVDRELRGSVTLEAIVDVGEGERPARSGPAAPHRRIQPPRTDRSDRGTSSSARPSRSWTS